MLWAKDTSFITGLKSESGFTDWYLNASAGKSDSTRLAGMPHIRRWDVHDKDSPAVGMLGQYQPHKYALT